MKRASALFVLLGAVLLAGTWRSPENLGAKDWNWFLGQTEAEITSLVHYGQFPLWSPWRHGGQVCFAQPESMFLSPVTLLALAVGTLLAFKLLLLPVYVAGALGMVALAGELGLAGRARLVPALVFFCSSVVPLYVLAGLPNWLCALAILPWLLWALRRARHDLRWLLLAGLLDAGLLFCGAIFWFTLFPVLLMLDGACASVIERRVRPLLLAGVALLVGVVLAAPRIVPLFEVHAEHPREMAATGYFLPPSLVWPAWLSTEWPDLSTPNGSFLVTGESAVYWPYIGAWIGPLALALAALGVLAGGRRALGWLLAGATCLWAAFGSGVHPSLWDVLHKLPGITSMHVPSRLMLLTTFCLALLAGFGWERVELWLARAGRSRGVLAVGLLALLVVPMLVVNAPLSALAFTVTPTPDVRFEPEFRQRTVPARPEQWLGEAFESVRANVGNPMAATDIPTQLAVATDDAPDYHGEVYLLADALAGRGPRGAEVSSSLTPNRIEVALTTPVDDLLVVNQSWFPGWRVEVLSESATGDGHVGKAQDHDGLIAVPVPAGRMRLAFVFDPPGAWRGMLIGALGLALGGAWLWARRGAAPSALSVPAAPEWLAFGAFGALALSVAGSWAMPTAPGSPGSLARTGGEAAAWLAAGTVVEAPAAPNGVLDLQPTLDAARAGALLLLPPGRYAGFSIPRGVILAALPGGSVAVEGPVTLDALPATQRVALLALSGGELRLRAGFVARDCAGGLLLQHVELEPLAGAASFEAARCLRVALLGVRSGAVTLRSSGASLLRCEVSGAPGLAAIDALTSTLVLRDGLLAGGAGCPATVCLRGGSLFAGVSGDAPDDAGGDGRLFAAGSLPLLLQRGARAVLSGLGDDAAHALVEPGSTLTLAAGVPPEIHLVESRYGGGKLLLELAGRPRSSGFVLLSSSSQVLDVPVVPGALPEGGVLISDPRQSRRISVTLPASGQLSQRVQISSAMRRPGNEVFVQFASETGADGGYQLSLPDAVMLELRGVRP